MNWTFPAIKRLLDPAFPHHFYKSKIIEELDEFFDAVDEETPTRQLEEAIDVYHAAETFLRKVSSMHPDLDLDQAIQNVIEKNKARNKY